MLGRMRTAVLVAGLLAAVAPGAAVPRGAAAEEAGRTETVRYLGATADLLQYPIACTPVGTGVGGACFDVVSADGVAVVTVTDDSRQPVAWSYHIGPTMNIVFVCSASLRIPLPGAAGRLYVAPYAATGALVCPGAAPATTGTITAEFIGR